MIAIFAVQSNKLHRLCLLTNGGRRTRNPNDTEVWFKLVQIWTLFGSSWFKFGHCFAVTLWSAPY